MIIITALLMKEHYHDVKKTIAEIKGRIEMLRLLGIDEDELKELLFPGKDECKCELSQMTITKDYGIYLTGERGYTVEVKLHPLAKVVYLLYLKYPDGISFKSLSDYKHELLTLYKSISNRVSIEGMEHTIDALTDPTRNTINEVCSTIKRTFVQMMKAPIAQQYIISGKKGNKKRIILDRGLINWHITI